MRALVVRLGVLLLCALPSGLGLLGWGEPTDPAAIAVLWARAAAQAQDDLTGDAWLDVAKHCERLRPWHQDHARCRVILAEIAAARAAR